MRFSRRQQQVAGCAFCLFMIWMLWVVYADTYQTLDVRTMTTSDPPDLLFYLDSRIDVNRANSEELQLLPDIGPVLANRIIAYRERHGHFVSPESLELVKGIGPKTVHKIHYYVDF
ncbi:hypothetical protein CSA56_16110 [candidate division KSB3 bacterium]|uniref:Helix-hairpin-helix DNA-binding motif class 1 domain-containing protein n=1 Tax=candidate division KSB3 bacterium TaxID=2044937 RepID=A0A2G6K8Z5_9BACT|nr:MAG: hypothetical protein CSA56_16110 [candidate division KSB3 bacterium]